MNTNSGRLIFIFLYISCSLVIYGQQKESLKDLMLDDTKIHIPIKAIGLDSNEPEEDYKGIEIEKGLFFTKGKCSSSSLSNSNLRNSSKKTQLKKSFNVNIPKTGEYFFAAHLLTSNCVEENTIFNNVNETQNMIKLSEVRVYINDKYVGNLNITKPEWELVPIKNLKKVVLTAGDNNIVFESDAPYYPEVDAVRISELEKNLIVENKGYNEFVNQLKISSQTRKSSRSTIKNDKLSQDQIDQLAIESDIMKISTKSAMTGNDSYNWQVFPLELNNPQGNYKHKMQVPITFTYYRKLYLTKGTYTFHTNPIAGQDYYAVDPVMYLFNINDPHNYSFYSDDHTGYHPRIQATVSEGDYYLVIRAYSGSYASLDLGRQGLVNVYQNGQILNTNMPIAGYMFNVDSPNTGVINYFTSYTTGIPIIWLMENGSNKMKFMGGQFFYVNPMDYMWWDDARIRLNKPTNNARYSMMISAEGAMGFYFGNCDAYGSCIQGPTNELRKSFPNMKDADCIISAPASNSYNCASWAGGRTDLGRYFWASSSPNGTNYSSPWYVAGNVQQSWDNFFGNKIAKRFNGAPDYTRNSPNYYDDLLCYREAEIALWTGSHASVRIIGNDQPHGYLWESKCGGLERMFHTGNAFVNSSYGSISQYYYRSINSSRSLTYRESIEKGLTVTQNVKLSDIELSYLIEQTNISQKTKSNSMFKTLLQKVIDKANTPELLHISNPEYLFQTIEYKDLLKYTKDNFDYLFYNLILESFTSEDNLSMEIISNLFVNLSYEDYSDIMTQVKEEWSFNMYDSQGAYIAPSLEANMKNYMKKIIQTKLPLISPITKTAINNTTNNDNVFSVSPNPINNSLIQFTLNSDQQVTILLTAINGGVVKTIINNKHFQTGSHQISLDANGLYPGIYICTLIYSGVKLDRKILVR